MARCPDVLLRWSRIRDAAPCPMAGSENAYKQRFWRKDRPRSQKKWGFGRFFETNTIFIRKNLINLERLKTNGNICIP